MAFYDQTQTFIKVQELMQEHPGCPVVMYTGDPAEARDGVQEVEAWDVFVGRRYSASENGCNSPSVWVFREADCDSEKREDPAVGVRNMMLNLAEYKGTTRRGAMYLGAEGWEELAKYEYTPVIAVAVTVC